MSYDVYLTPTEDSDGEELFWRNYTSNCAPMWRAAGADLADMDGKPASQCGSVIGLAVQVMKNEPARFKAMNPPNGWGDYDSCIEFLAAIADACERDPEATVQVSR
jgi:hypothetical protein